MSYSLLEITLAKCNTDISAEKAWFCLNCFSQTFPSLASMSGLSLKLLEI